MESNQERKGITAYWVDESWDEPMPFKYPLNEKFYGPLQQRILVSGASRPENNGWYTVSAEPKNLAGVEVDDSGGFIVPQHLAEEIKDMFMQGTGCISRKVSTPFTKGAGMNLFVTGKWTMNLDQLIDFRYDLDPITPELSDGDIYNVTISIKLSNDDEYLLDDLEEMVRFYRTVTSQSQQELRYDGEKTLGYYLSKSKDYYKAKEGKA
jgi:hypothetical protein